ncbi:MAG: hypothetical protein RMZ41_005495 [Nostoc sp. DedVER02]
MRATHNDTRRGTSLNYRDHSHVDCDRKSVMGTVQRTGGNFCIPVWSRGMARGF